MEAGDFEMAVGEESNVTEDLTIWQHIWMLTPIQYVMLFLKTYMDILMDRMVLIFLSFILGMVVLLATQAVLFWNYYKHAPVKPPPKFDSHRIELPKVLKNRLGQQSLKQKEDCVWFNFFMQFMFAELRESVQIHRFLTKKIQTEFEEVLKSRSGVLVDELFLRDFQLGDKFPVFMGISVEQSDVEKDIIQTLDLKAGLIYDGGFEIAIDAALPFGRMAYVSVKVLKLRGMVRFRFTLLPFSHWSMSFYEEPEIQLDVTAQLDGRPMPKLRNIIANQIRRIVRKKHTLPMYKLRFKPFFMVQPDREVNLPHNIHIDGVEIGKGVLEVTVISASRLPFVAKGAKVYCTVSVDSVPWQVLMSEQRKKKQLVTLELIKNSADQSLGMTVKDELIADRLNPVVVVEEISLGSPAHIANLQEGDILIGIGGNKVMTAKQAMKGLKWAKDNRIKVQIERSVPESQNVYASLDDDPTVKRSVIDVNKSTHQATTSLPSSSHAFKSTIKGTSRLSEHSRKTLLKEAIENPIWDQKFIFTVNPSFTYLNVCVWCKGGDRSNRTDVISSSKEDILIGYTTLNLDDVYLHCLITLNGSMHDKVKLKHGHFRTDEEAVKNWSMHKGWDPNLMYGDISLGFHFFPSLLTQMQRQALASCKVSAVKLQNELFRGTPEEDVKSEKPSTSKEVEELKRDINEGHHQFDSTTFVTATFCDYCGKKIWMKDAFKCRTCNMVCHKKCLVKCLVNTFCTDHGVKKRDNLDEAWEPLTASNKVRTSAVAMDEGGGRPDDERLTEDQDETEKKVLARETNSLQNLSTMIDNFYVGNPSTSDSPQKKADTTSDANKGSPSRFRMLKDQTDRMKDNVIKHLKRQRTQTALNDKAVLAAKENGARLHVDMDPVLRKDKLEEMIHKLDDQLKLEMENKEAIDQEISFLEAADLKAPSPKRKSEIKVLQNKAAKSAEKLDSLRLMMLQYCSALQHCIKSLEMEDSRPGTSRSDTQRSRPSAVGGFVRRASSSMKEKVSSKMKEFGKKGSRGPDVKTSDKPPRRDGQNNNQILPQISEKEESVPAETSSENSELTDSSELRRSIRSYSDGQVEESLKEDDEDFLQEMIVAASIPLSLKGSAPLSASHPNIEIRVDDIDKNGDLLEEEGAVGGIVDPNEPSLLNKEDCLSRSRSDPGLEIGKMLSLSPEDILRYKGTSLPKILIGNDSDSESDFFMIDSSDGMVSDSSDNETEGVTFSRNVHNDDDSDDGRGQHRSYKQQLQTFHV